MPKEARVPSLLPPEVQFGRGGVPNPCHDPKLPLNTMTPAERGDPETMARALRVCGPCDPNIKKQCLDWALSNQAAGIDVDGVYGETSLKQRRKMVPKPKKAKTSQVTLDVLALAFA